MQPGGTGDRRTDGRVDGRIDRSDGHSIERRRLLSKLNDETRQSVYDMIFDLKSGPRIAVDSIGRVRKCVKHKRSELNNR